MQPDIFRAASDACPRLVRAAGYLKGTKPTPEAERMTAVLTRLAFGSLLALFGVLAGPQPVSAQSPASLTIASEDLPPYSTRERTGFEDLLATEMYRRLGIELRIIPLPSERVLANANAGIEDGVFGRIGGMTEKYPNLVQFEESIRLSEFVAFSRRRDIEISGWDSLKPYNVGIITGWKILEWNIKESKSLTKVKTVRQLFKMLDAGRVDVVVYMRWAGLHSIRELDIEGVRIVEPPLATKKSYWYLHKKHRDLVPRASAMLREMKRDGTYDRIFEQVLGQLVSD